MSKGATGSLIKGPLKAEQLHTCHRLPWQLWAARNTSTPPGIGTGQRILQSLGLHCGCGDMGTWHLASHCPPWARTTFTTPARQAAAGAGSASPATLPWPPTFICKLLGLPNLRVMCKANAARAGTAGSVPEVCMCSGALPTGSSMLALPQACPCVQTCAGAGITWHTATPGGATW